MIYYCGNFAVLDKKGQEKKIHRYSLKEFFRGILLLILWGLSWTVAVPNWLVIAVVPVLGYIRYMYLTRDPAIFDTKINLVKKGTLLLYKLIFSGTMAFWFLTLILLIKWSYMPLGLLEMHVWGFLSVIIAVIEIIKPNFFDKRYQFTEIHFKKKQKQSSDQERVNES